MADSVFIARYWPFWTDSNLLRRFDYKTIDGSMPPLTSVFGYDKSMNCMKLYDYDAHLTLQDSYFATEHLDEDGWTENRLVLSPKGRLIADRIVRELLV